MEVSDWLVENTPELKIDLTPRSLPCASGLQFASRYVGDAEEDRVFDYLPDSMLHRIENRDDFPRVLVFDKWTGNSDGRQAVFVKRPNQRRYQTVFIDQGYCFNASEWNFPDSPLRGTYPRNSVYASVTGWHSFEPTLSRIEQMDITDLGKTAAEIPEEWYEHDSEGLTRLIEALYARRSRIRELITGFRNSTRNPFPNWNKRKVPHGKPRTTATPGSPDPGRAPKQGALGEHRRDHCLLAEEGASRGFGDLPEH
jgi:hypothetical protein